MSQLGIGAKVVLWRCRDKQDAKGHGAELSDGRPTSSNPSLSALLFHEKDVRKLQFCLLASLNRVRSSPSTITASGQIFLASVINCSLCRPWCQSAAALTRRHD
jgi:hypothetical protein